MWMDELTDFSSPFTLYLYFALFILMSRAIALWSPLWSLKKQISGTSVISDLFQLRKDVRLKGVFALFLQEIVSTLAPVMLALLVRIIIPINDSQAYWSTPSTIGFIVVLAALAAFQFWNVLETRDFLAWLSEKMPLFKHGVNFLTSTRSRLSRISNWDDPNYSVVASREGKEPLFRRNPEGSLRIDGEEAKARSMLLIQNASIVTNNAIEAAKGGGKMVASNLRDSVDKRIQKKFDQEVKRSFSPMRSFFQNTAMALIPLLYIFMVMYR
jgi:hypothetical protein